MDLATIAAVIACAAGLGIVVWVLAKLGRALITIAEALAAAAAVFLALWLAIKSLVWALHQTLTHWRTSLTVIALLAWWHWCGWASIATTAGRSAVITHMKIDQKVPIMPLTWGFKSGRYWDRTSDLFGVNEYLPVRVSSRTYTKPLVEQLSDS